jgi:DNA modification methylase
MLVPSRTAIALQNDGWILRNDVIWEKPNPMPSSVRDRLTNSYEHIFFFVKNKNYFYDADSIKEKCVNGDPTSPRGSKGCKTPNAGNRKQDMVGRNDYTGFNDRYTPREFRNKRDVWKVTPKPIRDAHFATFPVDLIEPCILAGCPTGGIVLDPFFGSGTTGIAATKNNRNWIGIELNPEYIEIANKRLKP